MNVLLTLVPILIICFVPLAVLVWFLVSLIRFLRYRKVEALHRSLTIHLVASSIVLGVIVVTFLSLLILFSLAIAHM